MIREEDKIQQACVMWFNNKYCLKSCVPRMLFFSVPNDAKDVKEMMRKKATGLRAGVSDCIMVLPNKVVFCEFKTPTGRQSPEQKAFELSVKNLGFDYLLFRSLEQFQEWCEDNVFNQNL